MTNTKMPIGLYTYPDDIPGVESIEIPANKVTRVARQAWGWAERLDDQLPGLGDAWRWTVGRLF
jgi:hypothetical protein